MGVKKGDNKKGERPRAGKVSPEKPAPRPETSLPVLAESGPLTEAENPALKRQPGSEIAVDHPLESAPLGERVDAMGHPPKKTAFSLASPRAAAAALIHEADAIKDVSVYFEDETYVTYESSRIPWWVRLMWLGFWLMAFFYVANYLWPDAQRYFGIVR
jgi:hypothetical protein